MLPEIIAAFESQPPAVAAFKSFAAGCADLARKDADNAALLLILALTARQYVEEYEGQPVSVHSVTEGRDALLAQARSVKDALGGNPQSRLAVANKVAAACLAAHPV